MDSKNKKRHLDFQVIAQWVNKGERVLDLGCGRGVLLEYLKQKKSVYGIGVDIKFEYVLNCVKRGVTAYHGDIRRLLASFDENSFDRVIFSHSIEFVDNPDIILEEGLRVGKRVIVGFVNHGFWLNRLNFLLKGQSSASKMYLKPWYETQRSNPFSIREFDNFCKSRKMKIENRVYLSGDLRTRQEFFPNFFASYAVYDLSSQAKPVRAI